HGEGDQSWIIGTSRKAGHVPERAGIGEGWAAMIGKSQQKSPAGAGLLQRGATFADQRSQTTTAPVRDWRCT
ncbi:hypothetical protein B8W90_14035, partial [Staphylococcus hominis]